MPSKQPGSQAGMQAARQVARQVGRTQNSSLKNPHWTCHWYCRPTSRTIVYLPSPNTYSNLYSYPDPTLTLTPYNFNSFFYCF